MPLQQQPLLARAMLLLLLLPRTPRQPFSTPAQALTYCDEQSHKRHNNFYQHRCWRSLAQGRVLAAMGDATAARASLEHAAAIAAEHRVRD